MSSFTFLQGILEYTLFILTILTFTFRQKIAYFFTTHQFSHELLANRTEYKTKMPNNCPVIHVTSDLDYNALNFKVEMINVMKPIKKVNETAKNGYSLKIQFSYDFNGKNYKCDNLRIRFDTGKIKRISTGQNGFDLSSFTMIDDGSPN